MSNTANVMPDMPTDVNELQKILNIALAKLMAYTQTVNELIKANMDMRAALHLATTDREQMQKVLQSLLNPVPPNSPSVPVSEPPVTEPTNADTVSA